MSSVLAIFGPTASGKSAVAEALADRIPARIVSADSAQLYRGLLDPDQPVPGRAWSRSGTSTTRHPSPNTRRWRTGRSTRRSPAARRRWSSAAPGSISAPHSAELDVPPAPAAGARERWSRVYDGSAPKRPTRCSQSAIPMRPRRPSERPAPRRAGARARRRGLVTRAGDGRLWTEDTRHPTLVVGLDVPREELTRRIEERTRAMFEAGVVDEARAAIAGPLSRRAARSSGSHEVAELPREEAIRARDAHTPATPPTSASGCAGSRASLRVRGDRPPDEMADEILALARRGQRYLLVERGELGGR